MLAAFGAEHFGDTEIQQLGLAVARDQDVARLQVAVNDQVLMCVLHSGAYADEEFESLGDVEVILVAVSVDRRAINVLHHQVRPSVGGGASVEQARDVGMVKIRQHLAFVSKAGEDLVGVHAAFDQLDRNLLVVLLVGAFGEPDRAHPPGAQQPLEAVGTDKLIAHGVVLRHLLRRGRGETRTPCRFIK